MTSAHPVWGQSKVVDVLKQSRRRYIYPRLFPYRQATFAGIRVSYKGHLDGGGRGFGQDFILLLRHYGLPKQARAFEWCAGPGFIGFSLVAHGLCKTLCLADIKPEAVRACQRTIADNGLSTLVLVYCSDNLRNIPPVKRRNLVVSSPPHFFDGHGDLPFRTANHQFYDLGIMRAGDATPSWARALSHSLS